MSEALLALLLSLLIMTIIIFSFLFAIREIIRSIIRAIHNSSQPGIPSETSDLLWKLKLKLDDLPKFYMSHNEDAKVAVIKYDNPDTPKHTTVTYCHLDPAVGPPVTSSLSTFMLMYSPVDPNHIR